MKAIDAFLFCYLLFSPRTNRIRILQPSQLGCQHLLMLTDERQIRHQ
jgi:hypothetical protein